jgi:GntR family transcriptional regulator, rspAB operon transcriptional repressor
MRLEPIADLPIRRGLPDQVYAILKRRILTCVLEPGAKLNERNLAEELNVSRTPLREALNRLALEGLVRLSPYKGYVVSAITSDDIRHLSELRRIVESEVVAIAAERATADECRRLRSLAELRYTPGDRRTYEEYLNANTAFHFALADCTHNPRLASVVVSVLDQLQRPLYLGLDVGLDARAATDEHLEVLDAIYARDPVRARNLATRQILQSEQRILQAIGKSTSKRSGKRHRVERKS